MVIDRLCLIGKWDVWMTKVLFPYKRISQDPHGSQTELALIRTSPTRCFRSIFQSNITNPSKHPCLSLHILHHPCHGGCASHGSTCHCGINRKQTKCDKIRAFCLYLWSTITNCSPDSKISHSIQNAIWLHNKRTFYRIKLKISEQNGKYSETSHHHPNHHHHKKSVKVKLSGHWYVS